MGAVGVSPPVAGVRVSGTSGKIVFIMPNHAFWCILDTENRQLLTSANPEDTARGEGCVGKGVTPKASTSTLSVKGEGVGNGERVSSSPTYHGVWERRELPQRGPGQSPCRKRISVLSYRHRMLLAEMSVVN